MSDSYTVYILKHLECEQLPLLLSHQVSYSLYKLCFITNEMSAALSSPHCLALPGALLDAPGPLATTRCPPAVAQPDGASQLDRDHFRSS